MQLKDGNWTVYSQTLGLALLFGIGYSLFIHWVSKKGLVGQTAWSVVVGVTFTLLTMIPFFGLNNVALMFPYFGFAGIPMIIEYIARVQAEIKKDSESAREVAKGLVNDRQTEDR